MKRLDTRIQTATINFGSTSLDRSSNNRRVTAVIQAALCAVDPYNAVRTAVRRDEASLIIDQHEMRLDRFERIFAIGVGKAVYPMALAMADLLGDDLTSGLVITKEGHLLEKVDRSRLGRIRVFEAGHPIPDKRGEIATRELMELVRNARAADLILCLISGGGSALMTAPVAGVELEELQILTNLLLRSGANINEINTLRKHLDLAKGGGIARLAAPASLVTLVLSDVVGDPLDVIASGPTVADSSTFEQCWSILSKYQLTDAIPASIREHLNAGLQGKIPETLKSGDPVFMGGITKVIGNNHTAAQAAVEEARRQDFHALLITTCLQGEAREAGRIIATIAQQIERTGQPVERPCCIVLGGETTVTVHGEGKGGRNTELALGAVEAMAGLADCMMITLATDGGDGPTDAAGAVVTGETNALAEKIGLAPSEYLCQNDSYTFFERLQDLLVTGPTRTNVNDLVFLFAF